MLFDKSQERARKVNLNSKNTEPRVTMMLLIDAPVSKDNNHEVVIDDLPLAEGGCHYSKSGFVARRNRENKSEGKLAEIDHPSRLTELRSSISEEIKPYGGYKIRTFLSGAGNGLDNTRIVS